MNFEINQLELNLCRYFYRQTKQKRQEYCLWSRKNMPTTLNINKKKLELAKEYLISQLSR